ncbi:FecR family protein [Pedobacter panaciterrae]|uniref:FecR family protein n=1 Tax=Pedobacter panaciterrae TaxID=363849 RepID=A0ABU8NN11_9SPHI
MHRDPGELLEKYKAGNCSEEEKAIVESWYLELHSGKEAPSHKIISKTKDEVWAALSAQKDKESQPVQISKLLLKVASWAAVISIVGFIGFIYLNKPGNRSSITGVSKKQDIPPGGNKAFLTLADGKRISLTDAANGEVVKQEGLVINKTADGQLVYTVSDSEPQGKNGAQLFNTIETPNGGKYQVNLPDGTRVWLNAASLLRYPTKFSGSKRVVELTGEGYFEVAKLPGKIPFIVKSEGQEVEVLGTHFNINSYEDEGPIKTTLLEGSVRVIRSKSSGNAPDNNVLLRPGEQSELGDQKINVKEVNTESILAWKDGDFVFDGDDLKSIMRKVARWYDVEVIYKGEFDDVKFGGLISRSKNISSVLGIMESTNKIHFVIEGNRITVLRDKK